MARDIWSRADIQQAIVAGAVLGIETAQAQGVADDSSVAGALAQSDLDCDNQSVKQRQTDG